MEGTFKTTINTWFSYGLQVSNSPQYCNVLMSILSEMASKTFHRKRISKNTESITINTRPELEKNYCKVILHSKAKQIYFKIP